MTINAISAVIPTAPGRTNLNNSQNISFAGNLFKTKKIPTKIAKEVVAFSDKNNAVGAARLFLGLKSIGKAICQIASVEIPVLTGVAMATDHVSILQMGLAAYFTMLTSSITMIGRRGIQTKAKILASELKAKGYSLEDRMTAVKSYINREGLFFDWTLLRKRTLAKLAQGEENTARNAIAAAA